MEHKAGYVALTGKPNAGKSTLMNLLIGEKLSIVTPKAQTTRHRILGIYSTPDCQIVFSDTPGIVEVAYELHRSMMAAVMSSLHDADVVLYLVDVTAGRSKAEDEIIRKIKQAGLPVVVALNKCDLVSSEQIEIKKTEWKELFPGAAIHAISALKATGINDLLNHIISLLPVHPPYYDKDELTDRNLRFIASEIIREKIFLFYQQEIPYSCHVEIISFKEDPDMVRIAAVIHVARESQKGILIGKKGSAIKKVGTEARKEIERWTGRQVFLDLSVKVTPNWRDMQSHLRAFGYEA